MNAAVPAVTVVVPVGRVDEHLEPQLKALVAQTAADFEVVLSLNSPDDGERRSLEQVLAAVGDPRFRIVDSSDRRGAAHARNVGASAALAPVLAFCDADDIVESDWLENIVRPLDRYDAVSGHLEEELLMPAGRGGWRPASTPGGLPRFLDVPYVLSGNTAIPQVIFRAVGGFDESLHRCEDIGLGFVLQKQGYRLGYAADATIHYRHRASLRGLVVQHYHYGKGMSQVLVRIGLPERVRAPGDAGSASPGRVGPSGLGLLRPNKNVDGFSWVRTVRRAGTLTGRLVGLAQERLRLRRDVPRDAAASRSTTPDNGTLPLERVDLFGLSFVSADSVDRVADDILQRSRAGDTLLVVTPNVDHLVQYDRNPQLRAVAQSADYLLPDGAPVVWASRLLRRRLRARLTGSDLFVPLWTNVKAAGEPIVVVASDDDLADRLTADHPLARTIVPPLFAADDAVAVEAVSDAILDVLERCGASLVVVGLSMAKTHVLTPSMQRGAAGRGLAPTLLLVGSAADFYVGSKTRAPAVFQRLGLEWLHRLLSEPRRLAKRYLVDDAAFVPLVLREAWRGRGRRGGTRV